MVKSPFSGDQSRKGSVFNRILELSIFTGSESSL